MGYYQKTKSKNDTNRGMKKISAQRPKKCFQIIIEEKNS